MNETIKITKSQLAAISDWLMYVINIGLDIQLSSRVMRLYNVVEPYMVQYRNELKEMLDSFKTNVEMDQKEKIKMLVQSQNENFLKKFNDINSQFIEIEQVAPQIAMTELIINNVKISPSVLQIMLDVNMLIDNSSIMKDNSPN